MRYHIEHIIIIIFFTNARDATDSFISFFSCYFIHCLNWATKNANNADNLHSFIHIIILFGISEMIPSVCFKMYETIRPKLIYLQSIRNATISTRIQTVFPFSIVLMNGKECSMMWNEIPCVLQCLYCIVQSSFHLKSMDVIFKIMILYLNPM